VLPARRADTAPTLRVMWRSRVTRALFVAITLAGAQACSSPAPAATPRDAGTPRRDAGRPPTPDAGAPFVVHEVGEGETLWDIARAYDVSVDDIVAANGRSARDVRRLSKGRRLRIPGVTTVVAVPTAAERAAARDAERAALPPLRDGAYVTLGERETIHDLARRFDVDAQAILERNQLGDDDVRALRAGRTLIVPGLRQASVDTRPPPPPREGVTHTVARGETIWDIASAFRSSVASIMSANSLSLAEVTSLREGARLFVPGVEADDRGHVRRRSSPAEQRALAVARRFGLGTREIAGQLLHGRVRPEWARAALTGRRAPPTPGTLRWPVSNGWYVRGYGSGEGGYHQAIDIAGEIGWNVRAAAPGIVAYSGDEVPGYGNMVMVVHPGGWVTMYAHNSANYVVAGERVPAGGVLAELGSTGISRGPHVHFELMHGGKNCDPARLFRPGMRHRNGRLSAVTPLAWPNAGPPPPGIACHARRRHPHSRYVLHEDPVADAERDDR
jgi:murein DD-endopeptidase MepM/ murein hydrolase activator NlpD